MKNNKYFFNTLLTAVLFAVLAVFMVIRLIQPAAVLPPLNIPNMVLVCLVALLIEYYLAPGNPRCYICIPVMSALTFGILPLMAGFACQHTFWKFGLVGGLVSTVTVWLFSSMADRMLSGPKAKAAAVLSAFGLYLAAQCFTGIIL
jgi:hypothetical protein